jgi:hypothetical protein
MSSVHFFHPTFAGSEQIRVGSGIWSVVPGSRLAYVELPSGMPVVYVLEREGTLRALTQRDGVVVEFDVPTIAALSAVKKYFGTVSL